MKKIAIVLLMSFMLISCSYYDQKTQAEIQKEKNEEITLMMQIYVSGIQMAIKELQNKNSDYDIQYLNNSTNK